MNNEIIKILLIEDNRADLMLVEKCLKQSTLATFDITSAETLEDGLKLLKEAEVDLILSDLSLPDSQGFDTFNTIHQERPDLPIIVLTGLRDEKIGIKSVHNGAQDYLTKGHLGNNQLVRSILYGLERSKKGKKDKRELQTVLDDLNITDREKEILCLLAKGRTNEEIAKALFLSISTIKNHIMRIYAKLRISNRAQASVIAIQTGLIPEEDVII